MNNFSLEVKIIVDNIFPYITVNKRNNTTVISGYMGELWSIIENALHFKNYFIKMSFKDGKEELVKQSVDVILIPVVVTTTDVDQFDFSIPVARSWYEMYAKRNGDGATSASYLETWNSSLWIAFILTIFALSTVLWIIIRTRKVLGLEDIKHNTFNIKFPSSKEKMNDNLIQEDYSFASCFFIVLGAITLQGFSLNPKSTSLRLIMLVVLFFGLLMINSYAAVLVSRLAVDKVDILFPTLESMKDKHTHTLCVRESSYAYRLFKENESDTELISSWRPIVNQHPCENITTVEDIAKALCQDGTVILETPHIIASILEAQKCSVTRMPGRYSTAYTSLLMRKNFEYKKNIDQILQKLLTSGIIDYLQKKWLFRRIPHSMNISQDKPVTINHINGVLLVYAISIFLSLAVLLVEKILDWKKSRTMITLEYIN